MMTNTIAPEMMARYRATARKREEERQSALDARYIAAWDTARSAATLLKERYGVDTVWLFGSLLNRKHFFERSDIDLAVREIEGRDFYRAVSALLDLSPEFSIDLIEVAYASSSLREKILNEGVEL